MLIMVMMSMMIRMIYKKLKWKKKKKNEIHKVICMKRTTSYNNIICLRLTKLTIAYSKNITQPTRKHTHTYWHGTHHFLAETQNNRKSCANVNMPRFDDSIRWKCRAVAHSLYSKDKHLVVLPIWWKTEERWCYTQRMDWLTDWLTLKLFRKNNMDLPVNMNMYTGYLVLLQHLYEYVWVWCMCISVVMAGVL